MTLEKQVCSMCMSVKISAKANHSFTNGCVDGRLHINQQEPL